MSFVLNLLYILTFGLSALDDKMFLESRVSLLEEPI